MSIAVGELTFDNVFYDEEADVLYMHIGDPATAVDFDESPEGHALRYDAGGRLVGITIINARWLLEEDGQVTVSVPQEVRVDPAGLAAITRT